MAVEIGCRLMVIMNNKKRKQTNVCSLSCQIFVVNPANPSSKDLLKMAEAFYVHSAPTRIGLLLIVDDGDTTADDPASLDASVAMWRAFQYIRAEDSGFRGLSFITDVSVLG